MQRPVRTPLRLAMPARYRQFGSGPVLVFKHDGARIRMDLQNRHLQDFSAFRGNRHKRGIARRTFLPQNRDNRLFHFFVKLQHFQKPFILPAGFITLGRRHKLVIEPERIQKGPQTGIVMMCKTFMGSERVRHRRQRQPNIFSQHVLVRHIVRHLAQTVHIIGKTDELRRNVRRQTPEGMAHHRGPTHFPECSDMRQPRRPISRFKQHIALLRRLPAHPLQNMPGFFKRPGAAFTGNINIYFCGCHGNSSMLE